MRARRAVALVALLASDTPYGGQAPPTVLDGYDLRAARGRAVALPTALAEVSGLATAADGRLFAHDDERAVVYQVDPRDGSVVKRFGVGRGGIRGDFEGIAVVGERFFLIESGGGLLEFREGSDGAVVAFRRVRTGLGGRCEAEGLAHDSRTGSLLIACKTVSGAALRDHVVVFAFRLSSMALEPAPRIRVPLAALAAVGLRPSFHPSGIEVHRSGAILLVAARDEAILELAPDGRVRAGRALGRRAHPQPEGVAFLADGSLVVADEAQDRGGRGTLRIYPRRGGGDGGGAH
jgi:uncharacterized protein YjiK